MVSKVKYLFYTVLLICTYIGISQTQGPTTARYKSAYPNCVKDVTSTKVIMESGISFVFGAKNNTTDFEEWLDNATLYDQLEQVYKKGTPASHPPMFYDPGRARHEKFFEELYGRSSAEVKKNCTIVKWIDGSPLFVTTKNGVDKHLRSIVSELTLLPKSFRKYLNKPGGTFNWRNIAGTNRRSTHSYGIAIDINVAQSHYWRSSTPTKDGFYPYKNSIPMEIVNIFERHGFIWGGKWYHYDTMHFEYRPELCTKDCNCDE